MSAQLNTLPYQEREAINWKIVIFSEPLTYSDSLFVVCFFYKYFYKSTTYSTCWKIIY